MNRKTIKTLLFTIIIAVTISFSGCSEEKSSGAQDSGIQGVEFSETGKITVTFRVPDGMTVEDVIGSELGTKTKAAVTAIDKSGGTSNSFMEYYKVEKGGLLSCYGDIYRYGPDSTLVSIGPTSQLPAIFVITETPPESEIFNPADAEKLKEKYGINLNFGN